MSMRYDPELDEILQDEELRRLGDLLTSVRRADPPLDEAFRSGLRRQLMLQAWETGEGRPSWWKRVFAPPGLAWVGATAGIILIASIVVFYLGQPAGTFSQVVVNSPIDGNNGVALQQPILVAFNQPMNHPSTEAAVQITPATSVTFSWSSNDLYVQPATGTLAPNTQYQVTIGPTAMTASGQPLTAAQTKTITFVTQATAKPAATPKPSTTPAATPGSKLTGEHMLARLGGGASTAIVQWSADSATVYVTTAGALKAVPAKGGDPTVLAPDGVSSAALAPAGDRLAYVRNGKLEILAFASGTTTELAVTPVAITVGWANDKLVWASADGFYTQGANQPSPLAQLPSSGVVNVISISPDGTRAAYTQGKNLFVLDLAAASSTQMGLTGAVFEGWSPDGSQLLYGTGTATMVVDLKSGSAGSLPPGDASWSAQDAIMLGGDTSLYELRPDGSSATHLADGTYRSPAWSPNATTFTFFRSGSLWAAGAPALPPEPSALDQAGAVVGSFMQARLSGQGDPTIYLDSSGKQAYSGGVLTLAVTGDARFSRYYILAQELTSTRPDTALFIVRLVLTKGKLDVSELEESLTLVRDSATRKFVIDQAAAGAKRDLGKGAGVVAVDVARDTVRLTFDSDLDLATVPGGVLVQDSKGNPVDATASYSNRVVTISGLDLKPGGQYRLVVLTTVRDVGSHNVASEYDLNFLGPAAPAAKDAGGQNGAGSVTASPSPTPSASPTPAS